MVNRQKTPVAITIAIAIATATSLGLGCLEEPSGPPPDTIRSRVLMVPDDYGSITAAIAASAKNDTIEVAPGTYSRDGFRDIIIRHRALAIRSSAGPLETIIDLSGDSTETHFGFDISGLSDSTRIEGFTIKNGVAGNGGAIAINSTDPTIHNCLFLRNEATSSGGAIRIKGGQPTISNCTFVANEAPVGGAVWLIGGASPVINSCIIALGDGGGSIGTDDQTSRPDINCTNIYNNLGGDWTDEILLQRDIDGNRSTDPGFCDAHNLDFRLTPDSPLLIPDDSCAVVPGFLHHTCE